MSLKREAKTTNTQKIIGNQILRLFQLEFF